MSGNANLEAFVNTIRSSYQQTQNSSPNFTDIYNTINSHLDVFKDNGPNLLENVLPVFTLPEYTLPNMAVLYAIISQVKNITTGANAIAPALPNVSTAAAANTANTINQEKLLNDIESCLNSADYNQVD